jgi:hypothetical protein
MDKSGGGAASVKVQTRRCENIKSPDAQQTKRANNDLLSFWKTKRHSYPRLAVMALEILSVPAMSAEVERVFSSGKLTLSDQRARLDSEIVEALEYLRHWNAAGIIASWEV